MLPPSALSANLSLDTAQRTTSTTGSRYLKTRGWGALPSAYLTRTSTTQPSYGVWVHLVIELPSSLPPLGLLYTNPRPTPSSMRRTNDIINHKEGSIMWSPTLTASKQKSIRFQSAHCVCCRRSSQRVRLPGFKPEGGNNVYAR